MQRTEQQHMEELSTQEILPSTYSSTEESGEIGTSPHIAQSIEQLSASMKQETKQYTRSIVRGMVVLGILSLLVFTLNFHTLLPPNTVTPIVLSSYLIFSLCSVSNWRRPRKRWRNLTSQLVEKVDIKSIGSLVDALGLDDKQSRQGVGMTLTKMLPQLKASDANVLNEEQRARLLRVISVPVESPLFKDMRVLFRPTHSDTIDFYVAILKAFEQVGDSKALPVVEKLAQREPKTEGERRIQEAAQTCLPFLRQRAEQQTYSQTLLRPAEVTSDDAETLLRAASGAQETDPESLLRPSQQEN